MVGAQEMLGEGVGRNNAAQDGGAARQLCRVVGPQGQGDDVSMSKAQASVYSVD